MNPLHYPSLELCKKLTQVGFPTTDNLFAFDRNPDDVTLTSYEEVEEWSFYRLLAHCPSVMEMLDVMPEFISFQGMRCNLRIQMKKQCSIVSYIGRTPEEIQPKFIEDVNFNIPNALAGMILWLVENKHLSFNK